MEKQKTGITVKIVKGHCGTWKIGWNGEKYTVSTLSGKGKVGFYETMLNAHRAIRVAEQRCVEQHPETPVANRDVWFDHNILIVDDNDGGYYCGVVSNN